MRTAAGIVSLAIFLTLLQIVSADVESCVDSDGGIVPDMQGTIVLTDTTLPEGMQ